MHRKSAVKRVIPESMRSMHWDYFFGGHRVSTLDGSLGDSEFIYLSNTIIAMTEDLFYFLDNSKN